jgi:hypothetical protein
LLLVAEVTPFDQIDIPRPSVGDRVAVFGVRVHDAELTDVGIGGWREIHLVRYIEINGKEYGECLIPASYSKECMNPAGGYS